MFRTAPKSLAGWLMLQGLLLVIVATAAAEVQEGPPSQKKASTSFYGLTETEVAKRFGDPDDKRTQNIGSSEWKYGRSMIFFAAGKVSAWSDLGELAQREQLVAVQTQKVRTDDSLSDQWENPWTPPKRSNARVDKLKEIIDE